jgi:hypothetical protein
MMRIKRVDCTRDSNAQRTASPRLTIRVIGLIVRISRQVTVVTCIVRFWSECFIRVSIITGSQQGPANRQCCGTYKRPRQYGSSRQFGIENTVQPSSQRIEMRHYHNSSI